MRWWVLLCWFSITACGSEAEDAATLPASDSGIAAIPSPIETVVDTTAGFAKDTTSYQSYAPAIKTPSGIYQFTFPYSATTKILHTIAFYPGTFRLQEEYFGGKDSIVITEGTWAPSQGFIWLYKDQLARGRYKWKGDTLQYYSPQLKNSFSLAKLTPASTNKVWMDKKKQGAVLFAIGTEPFWSVEINKRDSIVLSMPDWTEPLRVKAANISRENNKVSYAASTDSLLVTVQPYFCSDGMSDFVYTRKVTVRHKGTTYQGCGIAF